MSRNNPATAVYQRYDPAYHARRARKKREELAGRPMPDVCEVCARKPTGKGLKVHFDHCHKTGTFRGWLCAKCNTAIGLAEDSPEILEALAAYLRRALLTDDDPE